jgi:hypothetical protein
MDDKILCSLVTGNSEFGYETDVYFNFGAKIRFPDFLALLKQTAGADKPIESFCFVDMERLEMPVTDTVSHETFLLWAQEMKAFGKGLFIRVKLSLP